MAAAMGFPPAAPHGELEEVLPDIFFVQGTVQLKKPRLSFSRNMTVIRHEGELTLVNTVRLDEAGLERLDALGEVKHVVRIAGFHGMDDPFYKDRYGAEVWAVKGQKYARGFDNTKAEARTYFEADVEMSADTALPFPGAKLIVIEGETPEALVWLERDGGILITGDALQNWRGADPYFSLMAKIMMRFMGFLKPHNVGPGWLKQAKPRREDLATLLKHDFDKVLPSHGETVMSEAKAAYRPALERALAKLA